MRGIPTVLLLVALLSVLAGCASRGDPVHAAAAPSGSPTPTAPGPRVERSHGGYLVGAGGPGLSPLRTVLPQKTVQEEQCRFTVKPGERLVVFDVSWSDPVQGVTLRVVGPGGNVTTIASGDNDPARHLQKIIPAEPGAWHEEADVYAVHAKLAWDCAASMFAGDVPQGYEAKEG